MHRCDHEPSFQPDFLQNEVLNHDLSRNPAAPGSRTGHAIGAYWMVMRAVRRKDRALWIPPRNGSAAMEVAWDDVYGGAFRTLYDVDRNFWETDKVSWLQERYSSAPCS